MAVSTTIHDTKLVNKYTNGDQFSPAISALADGGYLVTWTTATSDGRLDEIYAQRYDASGNKVGDEIRDINSFKNDDQSDPAVTLLNDGSYVISWSDLGTGSVAFQRYSSAGAKLGDEVRIDPLPNMLNSGVSVSALKNGGFVVTWESADSDDEEDITISDIYAQRFDTNGLKLNSPVLVSSATPGTPLSPAAVGLDDGGYLVVWESPVSEDRDNYNVYARRYDGQGNPSDETQINKSITAGYQGDPAVAKLANGGYVIAWQDQNGIYLQRFAANGATDGDETAVTTGNSKEDPAIVGLNNGGYVVTWAAPDGDSYGIYAQRFNALGDKVGGQVLINKNNTAGDQEDPIVTALADGGYVIGWASGTNIYTQRFDANGNKLSVVLGDDSANTLTWTAGNAVIMNGGAGNDSLTGGNANDHLNGGTGNDTLNGGAGDDRLIGGTGNDTYVVNSVRDIVKETSTLVTEIDTVRSTVTWTLGANLENLILTGTSGISGTGNSLANRLTGNDAANALNGLAGNDTLNGGKGNDILNGGSGNDTLNGGDGVDRLIGGAGKDVLNGGLGNDTFVFNNLSELGSVDNSMSWDVINDFKTGDKIGLSALDANTTNSAGTNDKFLEIIASSASFTKAGQLKLADGVLYGNTDGDGAAEFAIKLTGVTALTMLDVIA